MQKGDSLFKLSYLSGVASRQLKQLNNLVTDTLVEGMILKFPKDKLKKGFNISNLVNHSILKQD